MTDTNKSVYLAGLRSFLKNNVDVMLGRVVQTRAQSLQSNQDDLFGDSDNISNIQWNKNYTSSSVFEVLLEEKNSLGLYVSGNPVDDYSNVQTWVRDTADNEQVYAILINKSKKIYTKTGVMMFALQITFPKQTTQYEGIIFPKNAMSISPILEEKQLFWVKGKVMESRAKKSDKVSEEGEFTEFVELPKIAIEAMATFTEGPLRLFINDEVEMPVNRSKKLESIDWSRAFSNPLEFDPDKYLVQTKSLLKIYAPSGMNIDMKKLQSLCRATFETGRDEVELWIESGTEYKKAKGTFWVDLVDIKNQIAELIIK
jgi:hypothetical protein